jgi:hypothetical protein
MILALFHINPKIIVFRYFIRKLYRAHKVFMFFIYLYNRG